MAHECRSRVHEDTDEDRYHGVWQDIHMDERVADEHCREEGKDDDEGIDHSDAARLVEIVFAIETQVKREAQHQNGYIQDVPEE